MTLYIGMRIGGAEVDCNFLQLVETEHCAQGTEQGTAFANMMTDHLYVADLMHSIEQVKVNFSGCEQRILDLPTGQVLLGPEKIRQALDPVVEQIIILVVRAINTATRDHQPLNLNVGIPTSASLPVHSRLTFIYLPQRVLLEGGFAQSPYLRARMKQKLHEVCPLEEHDEYW